MANTFKSLLQGGQPAIGSWIGFADAYSVEMMADVGFDWLLIDTEHFPIDRQGLRTILVSMKASSWAAIVRLPSNSQDHFQTALDLGAQGVVVPMINTRQDAERAVGFCRYPPLGIRGFSPTRCPINTCFVHNNGTFASGLWRYIQLRPPNLSRLPALFCRATSNSVLTFRHSLSSNSLRHSAP